MHVHFAVTSTIHEYVRELCGSASSLNYELRQWRETRDSFELFSGKMESH